MLTKWAWGNAHRSSSAWYHLINRECKQYWRSRCISEWKTESQEVLELWQEAPQVEDFLASSSLRSTFPCPSLLDSLWKKTKLTFLCTMMNTYHQKDHHLQGINGYLVMALSVNAVQQQQQPYQLRKVIYSYLQQVFRIVIVGVDDAVLVEYSKFSIMYFWPTVGHGGESIISLQEEDGVQAGVAWDLAFMLVESCICGKALQSFVGIVMLYAIVFLNSD